MDWYIGVLKKYVEFSGRARRQEYWMFLLINLIVSILIAIVDGFLGLQTILLNIYSLAVFLPSLAVAIRRLHDTGRTGWWVLINFVPIIGLIVFIIFMALAGDVGENSYGDDPKN